MVRFLEEVEGQPRPKKANELYKEEVYEVR
jgi:hypothetical protein